MSSSLSKKTAYLLIALTGIALDQLTKWEILAHFQEGERLNIIPSLFDLTLASKAVGRNSFSSGWHSSSAPISPAPSCATNSAFRAKSARP